MVSVNELRVPPGPSRFDPGKNPPGGCFRPPEEFIGNTVTLHSPNRSLSFLRVVWDTEPDEPDEPDEPGTDDEKAEKPPPRTEAEHTEAEDAYKVNFMKAAKQLSASYQPST